MNTQYETYYEPEVKIRPVKYTPILTILFITVNLLVFLYVEATGGSENVQHMIDMGAMYEPAFLSGEYYRLITHFFLHFGWEHIGNNMLSLFILGYTLEGNVGRLSFFFIYFFSGILAGATSMIYNITIGEDIVSAGASGAVYGLMGALLALMVFRRHSLFGSSITRFLLYIGLSIYSGMRDTNIDNAAHIGGVVSGFLICACMSSIKNRRERC